MKVTTVYVMKTQTDLLVGDTEKCYLLIYETNY